MSAPGPTRMPTVLNVNDNEATRYMVTRVLKSAKYRVIEAENGLDAIVMARQERPDLVVLDVHLPDVDGFEVCRRLRAYAQTADICVLHTSATFVSTDRKVQGLDSGADGYLTQPLEAVELLATVRAILRARAAEEETRLAAREWQATFDAIRDGVCILDVEGSLVRSNAALPQVLGLSPETSPGRLRRALDDLLAGLGWSQFPLARGTCRATAELESGDLWLRASGDAVLSEDGDVTRVVLIVSDISPRKKLEEALRARAQELAETDRRKDEFLAMLAHELRNPLSAISNATELQGKVGPQDPQSQRLRQTVHRQTRHLARLVDDLLDVSRITRGRIELRREPMDLGALVDQVVRTVGPAASERGHRLEPSLPAEPVMVHGDALRLEQVVTNLVNNAIKYTEPGGVIGVTLKRLPAPGPGAEELELRVSDTGVGISGEMLRSVFDMFVQADQSLDRTLGGLGIGLTVVKSLVEMHGGSVTAESRGLGRGSQFVVRLPLLHGALERPAVRASSRHPDVAKAPSDPVLSLSMVLVEDNADAAETLCMWLESEGHQVRTAAEGESGIAEIRKERPDVALLDIGLPGFDGYQVAETLRRDAGTADLFLVAMTGYGRPEDRARARAAGFDAHLVKPLNLPELRRILATGAAGRSR
jgi:signal transduction histidine kinase